MFELQIESSTGAYPIKIGTELLSELPTRDSIVIADRNLEAYTKPYDGHVIFIEADEHNKTLTTCESVIQDLRLRSCNRGTTVIAIGGGFVQDIATLVSALYMRGVRWIYVPTTLMAMMDSCIGGKSSINVGAFKNLAGNFYPPKQIIIDLRFAQTLTDVAIASGLSEGVKICYARGQEEFEKFQEIRSSIASYDSASGAELVAHVLNAKKWFVETDEFDVGARQLLNFGHTFGHALESATDFAVPHGIAVSLGILAALNHPAASLGEEEVALEAEVRDIIAPVLHQFAQMLTRFEPSAFEKAFLGDKKHTTSSYRLILPAHGALRIVEIERNDKSILDAISAMETALESVVG